MAHMLNTAAARGDWTGDFEAELVNTLLALVVSFLSGYPVARSKSSSRGMYLT